MTDKQNAAEAMYEALKALIEKCEVLAVVCPEQMDAAHAAIDLAEGHANIPGFGTEDKG